MSEPLPELLDPRRAAAVGAEFEGRLPLSSLPRLRELLVDTAGDCHYHLRFGRDRDDRDVVTGRVSAVLRLRCQRCCGIVTIAADSRPRLILVEGLDEAARLPDDAEALLATARLIRTSELIEEELLLEIPAVPRHAEDECAVPDTPARRAAGAPAGRAADAQSAGRPAADGVGEVKGPFAVLTVLKGRKDEPRSDPDPTVSAPSGRSRPRR